MSKLELSIGDQVLVDGVPAVMQINHAANNQLRFFTPGSPKPSYVFGRPVVGQWNDVWLKQHEIVIYNSLTKAIYRRDLADGGDPASSYLGLIGLNVQVKRSDDEYNISTPIGIHDVDKQRVKPNYNPTTHIDYQAWENAFTQAYEES